MDDRWTAIWVEPDGCCFGKAGSGADVVNDQAMGLRLAGLGVRPPTVGAGHSMEQHEGPLRLVEEDDTLDEGVCFSHPRLQGGITVGSGYTTLAAHESTHCRQTFTATMAATR